jgi:hypothetical protein
MSKTIHELIHDHFAARGDHLGAQHPDPDLKIVPGHGVVGARQVVCRHSNMQSADSDTLAEISAKGATNFGSKQGE